jgi:guanylate kinase
MPGQLFVISGPSGAGKSTVIAALRDGLGGLAYSISHTTRRPRGEEVDGVHYHFVGGETFEAMIAGGAFVEWAKVYDDLYGTSFAGLDRQLASEKDVLLDVDAQGAESIRRRYPHSVLVYLLPPSLEALEMRLKGRRTDDDATVRGRLDKAQQEIRRCAGYDYIVINDQLDAAVEEVRAVIVSERCRSARRMPAVTRLFSCLVDPPIHP